MVAATVTATPIVTSIRLTPDRLERSARSSFDHLLPAQGSVKTGPRVTILSRNLAAGSAFAMLVEVWQARSKPMVESMGLSWQQGPLSTGAIGRFLVPEPLPKRLLYVERSRWRMRVRASGGSESPIASSRARRWFRTVQTATSTSARRSMSRWRAGGGCERLGSTFGPHQSGAGHAATSVGECRTSA